MLLCFWLVILFLDGAFSNKPAETEVVPNIPSAQETMSATPAPVDEVTTMVSGVVHQSLGNSQIFQDLNVLEYLYTKNKNPDLLQPLVEKFLQYYQFDKANQYLTLLVQVQGDYSKLAIDPRQVIYTRLNDSSIALDSAHSLDDTFTLINTYRNTNLITHDDALFYQ